MDIKKNVIYHEKQRLQFCLLHALNNLFQSDTFSRQSLNAIAEKIILTYPGKSLWAPLFSPIARPHHNTLTGNYDTNVLMAALGEREKHVIWHDHRNRASAIDLLELGDDLFGIVLNITVPRLGGLWESRHWVTLKEVDGVWFNMDSHLAEPKPFQDAKLLCNFLDHVINHGGEVLLVMNNDQGR